METTDTFEEWSGRVDSQGNCPRELEQVETRQTTFESEQDFLETLEEHIVLEFEEEFDFNLMPLT